LERCNLGEWVQGNVAKHQTIQFVGNLGGISFLFGESMMSPSAYKLFEKHTLIRKSMGMWCLAMMIQDSDITNTIMKQLTQANEHEGVDSSFLTDIESVITGLKDYEIALNQQQVTHFFQQYMFFRTDHN
jgi:hypothetical protein